MPRAFGFETVMGGIDFARAEAVFAASIDNTIGLEEEFAICDPLSLDLIPRFERLRDLAAERDSILHSAIAGELISSEIELVSGRSESMAEAHVRQQERRRRLFALCDEERVALAACGTHPWADYRTQPIIQTEHYRLVEQSLKYVAWRNNTFSLHVHVGVRDLDRAVKVCDRLRSALPALLALSANSPFLDGRDSGLHSARSQIFTRNFPRCGIPESFGSWQAYRDYLGLLLHSNSIVEFTQVWWSVRPHLDFGTVEVRICDAQATASESEALASLIAGCVAQAARDVDEGTPAEDLPGRLIEENFWRAIRNGMDGRQIDFKSGEELPAREAIERLLRWSEPVRAELSIDASFPERNGAQRQRAAIAAGASPAEVLGELVRESHKSYAQEVTV